MLLKRLTEASGVSGNEREARDIIQSEIDKYVDEIRIDNIGNLIAIKRGSGSSHKVMIAAHMDEVGFIITRINKEGLLQFRPIGSIDDRVLISKRVLIGKEKVPGVIGSKPIHLQEKDEREKVIKIRKMYIDIGAGSREEADKMVSPGDYAVFSSDYTEFGDQCIKAKALDDRVGCAALVDILKQQYRFDLYACFTAQEEIGMRGGAVAAYTIAPDIALVLEGTTCSDVPGIEENDHVIHLGEGAALTFMDKSVIVNRSMLELFEQAAREKGIKYQYKQAVAGANDAGKIHVSRAGIPTAVVSVPCRYIHSPCSVMHKSDLEAVVSLVKSFLEKLGENIDIIDRIKGGG